MKKERNVIEHNAVVVFDSDVNASELNELFKGFQGDIIINGDLILDAEELRIKCDNLYVIGGIKTTGILCAILVEGNMYTEGYIDCLDININGTFFSRDTINAYAINISEDLYCLSDIYTNGYDINVGGELVCEDEIDAAEILVLQNIHVKNRIEADSIKVG